MCCKIIVLCRFVFPNLKSNRKYCTHKLAKNIVTLQEFTTYPVKFICRHRYSSKSLCEDIILRKKLLLSCTLRKGCVRTLWIRAPYWEKEGGSPPAVTKSVS
jgi:hypothetical protein